MDPDENLEEQRDLTEELRSSIENEDHGFTEDDVAKTDRLVDLVKGLDEWIMKGSSLPEEWALRCNGGLMKRAELVRRVYEEAFEQTETFEGELGMQLAYLFGAILKGDHIVLELTDAEQAEVFEFFEIMFEKNHPVWEYIRTENALEAAS